MIRTLRRRFMLSAMTAFAILLAILILSISCVSYFQMNARTETFMDAVLADTKEPSAERQHREMPLPRIRIADPPIAYYDVHITADGTISGISEKGIWEPDMDSVRGYAEQILASGHTSGKTGGFRFRLHPGEDGSARLIFLDTSSQTHMLWNVMRTTVLLSIACLALLFLILLPISGRVVRSYAQHIEKQKQFITNAGHEIKTPVAIILSNIDAMELIQGENKWSRNIRSQTDRLSALLQRLLFMSRIDEKSAALPMQTLEFNPMLEAETETYAPMLAERSLTLKNELPAGIRLKGNRDYLQQMIHMLLDNAVQYADEGGEIRISAEQRRRCLRLMFTNTVDRLPDCPPENLFDRFYRGDSARTQSGGGYGIGLSAARAIAEIHQGSLHAEYLGVKAIRFTAEFPL